MMKSEIVNKLVLPRRGKQRTHDLRNFAQIISEIQKKIGFKLSSRGWCYQLEGFNLIDKGQFNRVQKVINECRKEGLLPIDFVAEDSSRRFEHVWRPEEKTPLEKLQTRIKYVLQAHELHNADYWAGEEQYIQIVVEKIDLVTLFGPICKKYHIAIANSKGWSSISQRAQMIQRFKEMEETGHQCVLLYCGDHDPFGLAISDYLRKNLKDLEKATGWDPSHLIIDRFGLNYEFITENNLTWIENLQTGSGKKADLSNPIVQDYVRKYGERKVEANAIVVRPQQARELCENAILKYLGEDVLDRFLDKAVEIQELYAKILEKSEIRSPLKKALESLEDFDLQSLQKEEGQLEDHDSPKSEPTQTPQLKLVKAPHVKIRLYAYPDFFIGEAWDVKLNKQLGLAGHDGYIYSKAKKRIGKFNGYTGDCFLYEEET